MNGERAEDLWQRLKNPLIWTVITAALALLGDFLMIRHAAILFSSVLGDLTPYFEGLSDAVIGWDPLWMSVAVIMGGFLFCLSSKKGGFAVCKVVIPVIFLAAGLILMRVNSIPVLKMAEVILTMIRGGVI